MVKVKGFSCYENVAIGIINPRPCFRWVGPTEEMEKIVAILERYENGDPEAIKYIEELYEETNS